MNRRMKDTEVEWIGQIPENWRADRVKYHFQNYKNTVGDKHEDYERLALTLNGVIKRSKDDSDGLQPEKFDSYQILRENSLVFKLIDLANVRTSRVGLSPYTGIVSPAYICMKHTDETEMKYAEYWFLAMWQTEVFNHIGNEGIRNSLNADDLKNTVMPYPSVSEQRQIVAFLDRKCYAIDTAIEKTKESIEKLEEYKKAVITKAVTKGLDPNAKMKDSGIKWVKLLPAHWNVVNPKALFTQRKDRAYSGLRQCTASQQHGIIYQDEYTDKTGNRVVQVILNPGILKLVEPGDFVISMRSFQGGLEYSAVKGSISSAYVMLIPNVKYVFPRYFRWLFKSSLYISALNSTSNYIRDGQAMRYSNFIDVPLWVAPLSEQKAIADYLDDRCASIDALITKKQEAISKWEEYKKSLIYYAVTGKIDCRNEAI